ncbi:MAG: DNA alkylation repair protein [Yoonia sp.]|nr:DNA alkylation repair protein [Yoonia sp.]
MNTQDALVQLGSNPAKAAEMQSYHKVDRPYLGVAPSDIEAIVKGWRTDLDLDARLALASELWDSNIHEGRIAAAKLLTQARIRPDDSAAWDLICAWVPDFDVFTIADIVAVAGQKRLVADPARLDLVETWINSEHLWTRRAAFMMTLPWTKQNHPKPAEADIRDRVLGWAADLVGEKEFMVQSTIAGWLRDLSKHDHDRVAAFIAEHGPAMKKFAVKEASRHLG